MALNRAPWWEVQRVLDFMGVDGDLLVLIDWSPRRDDFGRVVETYEPSWESASNLDSACLKMLASIGCKFEDFERYKWLALMNLDSLDEE